MSKLTTFECDVTGERFGAKNDVLDFEIRRHIYNSPFEISTRDVHIALDAIPEGIRYPPHLKYLGVKRGEVMGVCNGWVSRPEDEIMYEYKEHDDVTIDHYESFFQFVEDEILH